MKTLLCYRAVNHTLANTGCNSRKKKKRESERNRELNLQRLALFPNKWDAKVNSHLESLASEVDEQLTGYERMTQEL